ncbi:MAG: response regulator [Azospira oryzae]|nr:response regulator [Cytophaga sp.]PZR34048.1 MAG: response regulator [Azospira oryzae]
MKKVLIIDDDSRNIFALQAVLKAKGFNCLTATGAREGIDLLTKQNEVSIVLLDMMMPDMDGYEALKEIRDGACKAIPVIAVTAQAMVGDREKCLEAGANDYISKPIDVDQLLSVLQRFVK